MVRSSRRGGDSCCVSLRTKRKRLGVKRSLSTPTTLHRRVPSAVTSSRATDMPRHSAAVDADMLTHADVNAARNILRAGLAQRHEREADRRVA